MVFDWLSGVRKRGQFPRRTRRSFTNTAALVQTYEPRLLLAASTLGTSGEAINKTFLNYTVDAGLQRLLVVTVGDGNGTDIQSVTFNDIPLTQGVEQSDGVAVDGIWYLALGTSNTATSGTIRVVSNAGASTFIGAQAFQGVDQDNPFSSPQSDTNISTNAGSSLSLATEIGDLTIDLFDSYDDINSGVQTPGMGQTQIHNLAGIDDGFVRVFYNTSVKTAGTPTTTTSWTSDDDGNIHVAGVINGATEFLVNTTTAGSQAIEYNSGRTVVMDADGDFVVVWNSDDGSNSGIFAQRYNAAGQAQGTEFLVNTYTTLNQTAHAVAMDADGDFVITWSSQSQDGSFYGIYAQRYNALGVAQGSEFRVNTMTSATQDYPNVAMDADGDFVITWQSSVQDGSLYGIFAQRYNAAGVAQGAEFQVNTFTAGSQAYSSIAMDADGDFIVTWTSDGQDGSLYGIYAQRYNAAGVAQGSEFRVNTFTASEQREPNVAMDADGDFVITWQSYEQDGSNYDIYAQRYNAAGVAQGSEFRVNTFTANIQRDPSVAMDADGDFVITWESYGQDGSSYGIYAQRFNAAGVAQGSEFRVNTYITDTQIDASVALDADGDFVFAWHSYAQDGSGNGIYAQRYQQFTDTAGPTVTDVLVNNSTLSDGARLASGPTTLTVVFSENLSTTGGATGPDSVTNPANWTLTQNGNNVSGQIQSISFGLNPATEKYEAVLTFAAALTEGAYSLTANGTSSITDLAGNALDGDRNGTPGGNFTRGFTVLAPVTTGPEFRVNTTTTGEQEIFFSRGRTVAMDADGDFVVVWYSGDGSGYGVFAQRYNAAGLAQGTEFRVNTTITDNQDSHAVAMDADGDFVISWTSTNQDGSFYGIYAQRYNAAGVAQGTEFQVNTFTNNLQDGSKVSMDADGDFVITWHSSGQDGSSSGIYAQRYNAAGVAQGGEFQVNTYTDNLQNHASVALDADGDFVISWTSANQDGSSNGIYAQRYNAQGVAQGGEFQVNTYTDSSQNNANVTLDADGDFVIAWHSYAQDGSIYGIYAQRYNAAGVAQGTEFQVNTYTDNNQSNASVAMDADGDFVITWQSFGQDGGNGGIYAQRYNSAGVAQGSEFQVNTYTIDSQRNASVAMDADGDFVIAWQSYGQDGSGSGIYAQRYFANTTPSIADQMFAIDEASAVGTIVGTAPATDPDSFNTITYSFSGGNVNKAFDINPTTGEITVRRAFAIDFETLATFTLRVQATDNHGAFRKANVIVNLNDINDTPSISPQNLFVTPLAVNGTVVGNAMATDQDTGDTLTYSITGGNIGKAFAVDAMTGNITLIKASVLDPMILPVYNLTIQATDNHGAFRKAVMSINVSNQKPAIVPQTFAVDENSPKNTVVGMVIASDVDAGDSLTYTITGGNVGSAFALNSSTGQLRVNSVAALNFESLTTFNITVQATDLSGAFRKAVMTINVNNVNEQPNISPQTFNVNENAANGTLVGFVVASDPDAMNTLTYSITGGNVSSAFAINSMTGEITVNNSAALDFETRPTFNVTVQVTDQSGLFRKAVMTINLNNVAELIASPFTEDEDDLFSTTPSLLSFAL